MRIYLLWTAIVGALVAGLIMLDPPPSEQQLTEIFRSLEGWTYALAGGMAFLEVGTPVGLVAPTELAVPLAGAAAAAGSAQLPPLIGAVWVCAALGESVSFLAGRVLGRQAVERHGHHINVTPNRLARFDRHFARHGRITVVLARFGPYVRTLTPFLAGAAHMPYPRFLTASLTGTGLWAVALCTLGYILFGHLALVTDLVAGIGAGVLTTAVIVALAQFARSGRRQFRAPSASGSRPAWRSSRKPS
jgi:membrane-associated protein